MSWRRISTIARHELTTQVKGPLFWALVALIAFITTSLNPTALIPSAHLSAEGKEPFINSPWALASLFGLCGLFAYGLFAGIMGGLSVIRDDEAKVQDILHATPLTASEYIVGKLGGVVTALALVLAFQVVLAMAALELMPVENPDAVRAPFRIANYIIPALGFAVPTIWLFAALAFAAGERSRRPIVVFAVPTGLFLGTLFFFVTWRPVWLHPALDRLMMIFDPSGLRWLTQTFFSVDRGIEFYNTTPLILGFTFWLNTSLVIGLPLVAVYLSIGHCRRLIAGEGASPRALKRHSRPPQSARSAEEPAAVVADSSSLRDLKMNHRPPGALASLLQMIGAELREFRNQPGLYVFTVLAVLLFIEPAASLLGPFDAPLVVTTGVLAVNTIDLLTVLICLVLLTYTTEALGREQKTGLEPLLYATPPSTASILLAKSLASSIVGAIIVSICALTCLAIMAFQAEWQYELWPLALVWGLILLPTFLFWNALVSVIFALVRNRNATLTLGIAVLVGTAVLRFTDKMTWLTNWPLWKTLRWSDMGTFAFNERALWLNRGLVIATAIFLIAFAPTLFARTERDSGRHPQRWAPRNLARCAFRLAPFALLPIVAASALALEQRAGHQSRGAQEQAKAYWQKNFATWHQAPTAEITHLDVDVDLEPSTRTMRVSGTYSMINRTEQTLRRLPFTVGPSFDDVEWSVNGRPAEADERSYLHLLTPGEPLSPGDPVDVGFSYRAVYPKGITRNGGGASTFILPSGVVLNNVRGEFLPTPGFIEGLGIDRHNRYEPAEVPEDFWRTEPGPSEGPSLPYSSRLVVTIPSEYTVNSVGKRVRETSSEGRTTSIWESDYPVRAINLVAGRWDVRRQGTNAVYFHPDHHWNADLILDTLVAARERYSEWFYPYPWSELRLSEYPDMDSNAQGFPTHITFSEGFGFLAKRNSRSSPAFVVTAHEAAHQWWGHLVPARHGPGTGHLVEGMAHYSTLLLHESERGQRGRVEFAKAMETSYVRNRQLDSEKAVGLISDDGDASGWTVVYEKGAWVMWMLQEHLGREATFAGLQEFVTTVIETADRPALQDLLETLRPYATDPAAYQLFVDQWFFDVVLPEFRLSDTTLDQGADDWTVTTTIENVGSGLVTVEVGAVRGTRFAGDSIEPSADYQVASTTVDLRPGSAQQISWKVPFEPERVVVDPGVSILQLHRDRAVADL